mgnify:CR=1 FL=1
MEIERLRLAPWSYTVTAEAAAIQVMDLKMVVAEILRKNLKKTNYSKTDIRF